MLIRRCIRDFRLRQRTGMFFDYRIGCRLLWFCPFRCNIRKMAFRMRFRCRFFLYFRVFLYSRLIFRFCWNPRCTFCCSRCIFLYRRSRSPLHFRRNFIRFFLHLRDIIHPRRKRLPAIPTEMSIRTGYRCSAIWTKMVRHDNVPPTLS